MAKTVKPGTCTARIGAIRLLLIAAVGCGFTIGCEGPPSSLRPLYTTQELQKHLQNDLIKGKWTVATRDTTRYETVEFPRNDEDDPDFSAEVTLPKTSYTGLYQFEFTPTRPTKEFDYIRFNVALVPIGDRTFFDAVYEESLEHDFKLRSVSEGLGKDVHWFGTMRIEPNFLRFTLPSQDLFGSYAQRSSEDPDASTASFFDGTFVGSTNQLRAVMANDSETDEVYDSSFYFCRPDADCNLAVTEDQLKSYPKDSRVLDDSGSLYLARGDYPRATELFRRAVEIPPVVGYLHSRLGLALALAGNYPEARREFIAAGSTPVRPEEDCAEVTWTYYLEGSLSEVVQFADRCNREESRRSAEPILLKYFALVRLGKQKDAAIYLSTQSKTFVGGKMGQLLLLKTQGRLADDSASSDSKFTQRVFDFFEGLQAEAKGKDTQAAAIFENGLFARKDSLVALAGRNELDAVRKRLLSQKNEGSTKQ